MSMTLTPPSGPVVQFAPDDAHFRMRHYFYFWGLVTAGRREDQGPLPYGRMRGLKQRCDPGPRLNICCHRPRRRTIHYSSLDLISEGLWNTGCPAFAGHDILLW